MGRPAWVGRKAHARGGLGKANLIHEEKEGKKKRLRQASDAETSVRWTVVLEVCQSHQTVVRKRWGPAGVATPTTIMCCEMRALMQITQNHDGSAWNYFALLFRAFDSRWPLPWYIT